MTTATIEQEAPEVEETEEEPQEAPEVEETEEEPETFSKEYVQGLRDEAAGYRVKAKRADDLAAALWSANVTATGRLADPSDLAMPEGADPLDGDALGSAVDDLLARKPHLASRKVRGDVGQGQNGTATSVDLAGMLRGRA